MAGAGFAVGGRFFLACVVVTSVGRARKQQRLVALATGFIDRIGRGVRQDNWSEGRFWGQVAGIFLRKMGYVAL